jgi:hypothetical protein
MPRTIGVFAILLAAQAEGPTGAPREAERRALAYLAREVPWWPTEKKCFSCHNNGDAARALFRAARLKKSVPREAVEATLRWLSEPDRWQHNGGEGEFNDQQLARIQFSAALLEAREAGLLRDRRALLRAAELVASHQREDGSWVVDPGGGVGSPAAYGAMLATYSAWRVLRGADTGLPSRNAPAAAHADRLPSKAAPSKGLQEETQRYQEAVAKAEAWLLRQEVQNVIHAAIQLMALEGKDSPEANRRRDHCLTLIHQGEAAEGGWGPYLSSAPEPFDTALVLLALAPLADRADVQPRIERGRAYLAAAQEPDGHWPPTTRPPGAESYAQQLSTTGWAALALVATGANHVR